MGEAAGLKQLLKANHLRICNDACVAEALAAEIAPEFLTLNKTLMFDDHLARVSKGGLAKFLIIRALHTTN